MARFLFVISPSTAHFMAPSAVAGQLQARGHEVAWVAHARYVDRGPPPDAVVYDCSDALDPEEEAKIRDRLLGLRGVERWRFQMERKNAPLTRATTPFAEAAIDAFRPHVVAVHQTAYWGWIAARRKGVPWATLATGLSYKGLRSEDPLIPYPRVRAWHDRWILRRQQEAGLKPVPEAVMSPDLAIFFTSRLFIGESTMFPPQYRFVGPALDRPEDHTPFPWSLVGNKRCVFVSLGTLSTARGGHFFEALKEALGGLPIQVIVALPMRFGSFPDNFIVRPWVPQLRVLEQVHAVLSHGGASTVHEALAHGLPLVLAPIVDDQPFASQRVVENGAGIRVLFYRPRPRDIREAVTRVLEDHSFGRAAERLRRSFKAAGGSSRAADLLEGMLDGQGPNGGDTAT